MAGQERYRAIKGCFLGFRTMTTSYYSGANIAIVLYDVTNQVNHVIIHGCCIHLTHVGNRIYSVIN